MEVDSNGIRVIGRIKTHARKIVQPTSLVIAYLDESELYRRQNGKCFYCFTSLFPAPHSSSYKRGWTRDHFYPASKGNSLKGNMVLSCRQCNVGKQDDAPTPKEVARFQRLYTGKRKLTDIFGK